MQVLGSGRKKNLGDRDLTLKVLKQGLQIIAPFKEDKHIKDDKVVMKMRRSFSKRKRRMGRRRHNNLNSHEAETI